MEYVDLHSCVESKLKAIILYVDSSLTVRSQVPVKVGSDLSSSQISSFNIPAPQKVDLTTKKITKLKEFKGRNLKKIMIKDRLRQSTFVLENGLDGGNINVISELGYIEIKATVARNVIKERAVEWLEKVSSILEAIILLDEEMLSYLMLYLDPKIISNPTTNSILELDLLLHAKSAYPISNLKSFAIFKRQWEVFKDVLKSKDYKLYEKAITYCIGNQYKTLLDIFQLKMEDSLSFVDFLVVINELSMLGLINIEKVEFITVKE